MTAQEAAVDLQGLRAELDAFAAAVSVREPVEAVTDAVVAGVPVRTYGTAPDALVWAHGGGWVTGSLDGIDPLCRSMANRTGLRVVSVGYRLAPEHPFPAGLEDVLAVVRGCRSVVAVGGDSAGGALATVAAQEVPGQRALVLLCPWLDATLSRASVRDDPTDLVRQLRSFAALYTDTPADPRVSPLLAADLAGLPPVVAVTAGLDPLRDEAEELCARAPVAELRRWPGMVHGFPGMTALLPGAAQALDWAAERLVARLRER